MNLEWTIPWWLTIILLGPLLVLAIIMLSTRPQRVPWARRLVMVLLLVVIAARPTLPDTEQQTMRTNVDMFFAVDLTGSMNAEDGGPDGETRLAAAKQDMEALTAAIPGARYSIIGFDSASASQLPPTTDAKAVGTWAATTRTELTAQSQGSNLDRPIGTIQRSLERSKEDFPDVQRLLFVLSDGENTDGKETTSYAPLQKLVDGGAVLGYGKSAGGKMKTETASGPGKDYIEDPGTKSPAVSKPDPANLKNIASQLGVREVQRTGQQGSAAKLVSDVTTKQIPATRKGEEASFRDLYWPFAIALALLLIWEIYDLTVRTPRAARVRRDDA